MPRTPDITVAAVAHTAGRFLFVEERINQRLVFNQPAGHVERGESLLAAVVREVREETAWHFEPQELLGVYLSCASGYADLPPGSSAEDGLFRALLDCRVVLRTLRSLAVFLGYGPDDSLEPVELQYEGTSAEIHGIPRIKSASELSRWAENQEKRVYAELDSFSGRESVSLPAHVRFEGVLWLQSVRFIVDGRAVALRRLLMIDDVWKLRRKQRALLVDELTVLRPTMPVWLATRSSALGESLLSQGAREGRDLRDYTLEDM